MRYTMNAWTRFACAGFLVAGCSDFAGDPPDPGAAGPNDAGPRSAALHQFGSGGSFFNGSGGSFTNGSGGSNNNGPVSKATVVAGGLRADTIALDDQYVYAASDQGLVRVPKTGGTVTPIGFLPQQGGGTAIAVDGSNVYYVTNSGGIDSIPKEGGQPANLVPAGMGSGNTSLVLDGDTFYYTVGPNLRRAPVAGGAFTDLSTRVQTGSNQPNRLAVDPTNVYFVSFSNDSPTMTLTAISKTDRSTKVLATAKGTIGAIAAGTMGVVFTDVYAFGGTKVDVNAVGDGIPLTTLTSTTIPNANPDVGNALAIDQSKLQVYFSGAPGLLRYTGMLEMIDPVVGPHAIALDATDVYIADWSSSGGPNPNQPGIKKIPR
jgi:hypothetical protein